MSEPQPQFNENGLALSSTGVLIRMHDGSCLDASAHYLIECIKLRTEHEFTIASLGKRLEYAQPSNYAPKMIAVLEDRAHECDQQNWIGQAMAYRDAAGILRKALPR